MQCIGFIILRANAFFMHNALTCTTLQQNLKFFSFPSVFFLFVFRALRRRHEGTKWFRFAGEKDIWVIEHDTRVNLTRTFAYHNDYNDYRKSSQTVFEKSNQETFN